jgi:hypothetical protein
MIWNFIEQDVIEDEEGKYWLLRSIILNDWDAKPFKYVQIKRVLWFFYKELPSIKSTQTPMLRNTK